MKWLKTFLLFLPLSICFLGFFGLSGNASAASIQTSKFDLYYTPSAALTPYQWRRDILYSSSPTIIDADGGVRQYQFYTPNTTAGGNFVTLHFETNIVATRYDTNYNFNPWVNLAQQNIINCASGSASIVSRNISFATTYWHNSDGDNNTLTVYGDVVMRGFTQNQSYNFICQIGSTGYSFIDSNTSVAVWFEQNPITVNWFNDESLALQQTQVNQNNTIIYNQDTMIQQQEATNEWLTDDTAPSADTSSLGNAAGWLPPGPLDSILNLPIQFVQGIVGIFTGTHTCQAFTIPIPWVNYNLEIPCMRPLFEQAGWSYIWNGVGTIISAVLIFHTFSWLYKFVEKTLSMRENDSEVWGGL